jgi:hypothetical protein
MQFRRFEALVLKAKMKAANDTSGRSVVFRIGDFSFLPEGETAMHISGHEVAGLAGFDPKSSNRDRKRWASVLGGLIDVVAQDEPTRIGTRKEASRTHITASRIDRVYVSWSSLLALQFKARSGVRIPVARLLTWNLSGQSPVSASFSVRQDLPLENWPIPRWIIRGRFCTRRSSRRRAASP